MPINVTPDDVRGVLGVHDAAYSDSEDAVFDDDLAMPIRMAEEIVTDDLAPYSSDTSRLELVGAALAAAYYHQNGPVSSVEQADGSLSFDTADSLSYWRQAVQLDPTGRLAGVDHGEQFVFETT